MIAFDTSLVVRIAVGDNPAQKAKALRLLESDTVLIPKTVLLETEWVLRSRYDLERKEILEFLSYLAEAEGVVLEDEDNVRKALNYYRVGSDFADALHLASSGDATMHTLDRAFCRKAVGSGIASAVRVVA
ncbi:MAG TPA: type II toxin-antitoxin system VapC family toxin [Gammaproteobacteria bacterium]|nr:type II toxin-antitoxin system VapC family toxin [Gammaproteobacteria bacterium]